MSKPYLDKQTNKWKWGSNGQPIHDTKEACEQFGIYTLTDRLKKLRDILNAQSNGCQVS